MALIAKKENLVTPFDVYKQQFVKKKTEMDLFEVKSSWKSSNVDLETCISIMDEKNFKGLDPNIVNVSNCVQLCCGADDLTDPLQLTISLKNIHTVISRICFISQSKRIEMFATAEDRQPGM